MIDFCISRNNTNILKGIAIFFVLFGHMGYIDNGGAWGVHIFLIISGYGVFNSASNNELNEYWKKRFLTVYFPYLLCAFLFLLFRVSIGEDISVILTVISLLGLDFDLNVDPTMWYISYIFYWYFAFWFFWKMFKKDKIVGISMGISFIIFAGLLGYKAIVWHKGTIAWAYIFSFPLGVILGALSRIKINYKFTNSILKIFLIISLVFVSMNYRHFHRTFNQLIFTLLAALIPICIILICPRIFERWGGVFVLLGKYSYGMYLNEGVLLRYRKLFFPVDNVLLGDILLFICSFILAIVINKITMKLSKYIFSYKESSLIFNYAFRR